MISNRKTILILIDWFYPGFRGGGPIESCHNLAVSLSESFDIFVLTRNTDLGSDRQYEGISTGEWLSMKDGFKVKYLSPGDLSLRRIYTEVIQVRPDHLYINGMFSLYFTIGPLFFNLISARMRSVVITVAPRGMLLNSALAKKRAKKTVFLSLIKPLFRKRNVNFHVTNEIEAGSVRRFFKNGKLLVANNLPAQGVATSPQSQKKSGELSLIYLARIDPIKNLLLLLDVLKRVKGRVNLTIGGPVEDEAYWDDCMRAVDNLPMNVKVNVIGPVGKDRIDNVLQTGHLYTLLTQGENFGHTIFDALRNGIPVLISNQTPWKGLEAAGIGLDASLNNQDRIINYLCEAVKWDQEQFGKLSGNCLEYARKYIEKDINRLVYKKYFD